MQERQRGFDHPRSDDVKGRPEGGYEAGFGDRGYGDRGDFGDQGIDQGGQRESGEPDSEGAAPADDDDPAADVPPDPV